MAESKPNNRAIQLWAILLTWIVTWIHVFKAQRTNGGDLGDVLTRLGPVEVRRVARKNDNTAWRKCLHLIAIKLIAEADVEDARDDRVDTASGCLCGISFTPDGTLTLIV